MSSPLDFSPPDWRRRHMLVSAGMGLGAAAMPLGAAAVPLGAAAVPLGAVAQGSAAGAPARRSNRGAPVFVLNSLDGDVSVIDSLRWVELARIPTGKEPHHLYLTPDEKSVIVANAGGDSLTFIDPRTAQVQRTLRGILDPYQLRFSPDMRWLVTAANRLNHVDIYRWDGSNPTLAKRIATGRTPSHLSIDSRSSTVWCTMQDSNELVVIDLPSQTLKHRVKTGKMPADVFMVPGDQFLLVALTGGDGVEVYDVAGGKEPLLIKRLATGKGAHAFRAAGDGRHVFVSNRVANTITRMDYRQLSDAGSMPAPSGPDCMDVSSDGTLIMVASRWAGKLSLIDVAKRQVVHQVKVGKSPHGVWTLDHAART